MVPEKPVAFALSEQDGGEDRGHRPRQEDGQPEPGVAAHFAFPFLGGRMQNGFLPLATAQKQAL